MFFFSVGLLASGVERTVIDICLRVLGGLQVDTITNPLQSWSTRLSCSGTARIPLPETQESSVHHMNRYKWFLYSTSHISPLLT